MTIRTAVARGRWGWGVVLDTKIACCLSTALKSDHFKLLNNLIINFEKRIFFATQKMNKILLIRFFSATDQFIKPGLKWLEVRARCVENLYGKGICNKSKMLTIHFTMAMVCFFMFSWRCNGMFRVASQRRTAQKLHYGDR